MSVAAKNTSADKPAGAATVPTQAEHDLEVLPTLAKTLWQQGIDWINSHLLTLSFAAQLLVILIAAGIAWRMTQLLSGKIYDFVHQRTREDDPWLRRMGQRADELMFFAGLVVLLYGAGFAFHALEQNARALFAAANLANAWILIRMVSSVVVNAFWSKSFAIFAWTVAALNILGILGATARLLDSMALTVGETRLSVYLIIKALLLGGLLLWAAFALSKLAHRRINKIEELTPSVRELIGKILRFALISIAILIALNAAGIDLTALALFSGALGIGIGFGLQKVVSNFVSGIIVLLDRSIRPADVIEVGGTFGRVLRLGARYTSVITRDGHEFLIPNEDLITKEVINWSYSDRNVRRKVPIGISYDSDLELARELVIEAARETPRILDFPAPLCHLVGFGDSAVNLQARFWVADPENGVTNVQSDFLRKVWAKFRENNIAIPFPQRDIHLHQKGPVEVKLSAPENRPQPRRRRRPNRPPS